jgi:enoyl-CoA hydratase
MSIRLERSGAVATIVMDRPEARNAVDGPSARALTEAFREFERDDELRVGCSGAPTGSSARART